MNEVAAVDPCELLDQAELEALNSVLEDVRHKESYTETELVRCCQVANFAHRSQRASQTSLKQVKAVTVMT